MEHELKFMEEGLSPTSEVVTVPAQSEDETDNGWRALFGAQQNGSTYLHIETFRNSSAIMLPEFNRIVWNVRSRVADNVNDDINAQS